MPLKRFHQDSLRKNGSWNSKQPAKHTELYWYATDTALSAVSPSCKVFYYTKWSMLVFLLFAFPLCSNNKWIKQDKLNVEQCPKKRMSTTRTETTLPLLLLHPFDNETFALWWLPPSKGLIQLILRLTQHPLWPRIMPWAVCSDF